MKWAKILLEQEKLSLSSAFERSSPFAPSCTSKKYVCVQAVETPFMKSICSLWFKVMKKTEKTKRTEAPSAVPTLQSLARSFAHFGFLAWRDLPLARDRAAAAAAEYVLAAAATCFSISLSLSFIGKARGRFEHENVGTKKKWLCSSSMATAALVGALSPLGN